MSKKHKHNFDAYLSELDNLGYSNYYEVLNSKDYNIPQNRERVYVVSIRKDIDTRTFEFPKPVELKTRLRDLLDDIVDDKYFIDNKLLSELISREVEIETPSIVASRGRNKENPSDRTTGSKVEQRLEVNRQGLSNTLTTVQKDNLILVGKLDMKGHDQLKRVYSPDGVCPTITTMGGGNTEPKVLVERVNKINNIRKYTVDIDSLKQLLYDSKSSVGLTNKEIAIKLGVSVTTVEHWFRQDDSFSIPNSEIWMKLKDILNINTMDFDKSIMTFESKINNYDMGNRVYSENGISPTLTTSGNIEVKVKETTKKGYDIATEEDSINITFPKSTIRRGRVGKGVAQTLDTQCNQAVLQANHTELPCIYDDRDKGFNGLKTSDICPTLRAERHGLKCITEDYIIRKLTPLECWRLMDFDDEDYWKARRALEETYYNGRDRSNSQMYKMAGNSITVGVLEEIFKSLFI